MNNSSGGGLSIASVLTLIFVVLKLVGVISWSWWWVLSPLWLLFGLFIAIIVIVAVVSAIFMKTK